MTKKDWDYIAAVEKAVAEKYGKDSVQDFRSEWENLKEEKYLKQVTDARIEKQKRNASHTTVERGDIVIKRRTNKIKTERSCPVCKTYSFSRRDDLYMNRFQCCEKCFVEYVEYREERWTSGWRPGDCEWKPPLYKRFFRALKVFFNKFIRRIKNG